MRRSYSIQHHPSRKVPLPISTLAHHSHVVPARLVVSLCTLTFGPFNIASETTTSKGKGKGKGKGVAGGGGDGTGSDGTGAAALGEDDEDDGDDEDEEDDGLNEDDLNLSDDDDLNLSDMEEVGRGVKGDAQA